MDRRRAASRASASIISIAPGNRPLATIADTASPAWSRSGSRKDGVKTFGSGSSWRVISGPRRTDLRSGEEANNPVRCFRGSIHPIPRIRPWRTHGLMPSTIGGHPILQAMGATGVERDVAPMVQTDWLDGSGA
jgi:hypothetical protein